MINIFLQARRWFFESMWLVKQSLKISIFFGMPYLAMYVIFPAIPGMQFLGLFSVFIWPFLTIFIILFYQTLAEKKSFSFDQCIQLVKPKIRNILLVGLFSFFYAVLLSSIIGNDIVLIAEIAQKEQDQKLIMSDFSGIILKIIVIAIPFMMMTWFAPLSLIHI